MAKDRMRIVIEADIGSSIMDVTIENADPAQLFAAAALIKENARIGFAGNLAQEMRRQSSPITVVEGKLPS